MARWIPWAAAPEEAWSLLNERGPDIAVSSVRSFPTLPETYVHIAKLMKRPRIRCNRNGFNMTDRTASCNSFAGGLRSMAEDKDCNGNENVVMLRGPSHTRTATRHEN
eukprot:scaffold33870_cov14-Prasinocladus_malaysianus.AAC.1